MFSDLKLVIFDMDGLMFDTERISQRSWEGALEAYGYTLTEDIFLETLGANRDGTKMLFHKYYGEELRFDDVIRLRTEISKKIVEDEGIPVKVGLYELLNYLSDKQVLMAVATSANRRRAIEYLNRSGVMDFFDCIVCGDEVECSKPDPEIFIKAVEKLGCSVANTIVLEDSEAGIEAAHRGYRTDLKVI